MPSEHENPRGVDPDVDLGDSAQLAENRPREWDLLVAVGLGGVLGAEARYGLGQLVPHASTGFPASTFVINVTGCFLLGILMAVLLSRKRPPRLARPFLGVGVLGGYTTFSTFSVDVIQLWHSDELLTAGAYILATVIAGACAVWGGTKIADRAVSARGNRR